MGQIFLVRHGQASFGSSNYDQLSALGERQAGMLGQWFAQRGQHFDRIVTGTMMRHRQSAQACIGHQPVSAPPPEVWHADPGFNEYDHDEVLHKHRPDFADPGAVRHFLATTEHANRAFQQIFQEAMLRWAGGQHDADYREPWPVFRQRCIDALERLASTAEPSQTIAVFTSGGTISTLCQHVLQLPNPQVFTLNWTLVNSAVTKLYYRSVPVRGAGSASGEAATPRTELTLGYLNNYAHLEASGEREAITYR